jgi:hypothetical protein
MPNSKAHGTRQVPKEIDPADIKPQTGEVSVMADVDATNRREGERKVDANGDALETRTRNQVGSVSTGESSPIRMTKDGAELDVAPADVEAHRRMGFGFVR